MFQVRFWASLYCILIKQQCMIKQLFWHPAVPVRVSEFVSVVMLVSGVFALPRGRRPGTHRTGGWVGSWAGLDGCGKSRPSTGIRSPDLPALSESLHRLSCPGRQKTVQKLKFWKRLMFSVWFNFPRRKTGFSITSVWVSSPLLLMQWAG
jgi:hypothetical protein